jgi:zinc and cadmium transporter
MQILLFTAIATLISNLISLVGAIIFFWKKADTKDDSEQNGNLGLVSFAAGIMLAAAFFDLLPEAQEAIMEIGIDLNIFAATFTGILTFFFLERFVIWFHHHDSLHDENPLPILILVGDGIHNFIDGISIAAAFLISPLAGIVTTIAISAHEIPQEIADLSVLMHGGYSKLKATLVNLLSGLTALLGGLLGYFFLEQFSVATPLLLAFTAGMFIYIACSDLIPELHQDFHKQKSWKQSFPFLVGIILLIIITKVVHV